MCSLVFAENGKYKSYSQWKKEFENQALVAWKQLAKGKRYIEKPYKKGKLKKMEEQEDGWKKKHQKRMHEDVVAFYDNFMKRKDDGMEIEGSTELKNKKRKSND